MKLTNAIRDAFIRAALDDVPSVDYEEQIRKLLVDDSIEQLPPKVRALAKDTELNEFLLRSWYYGDSVGVSIFVRKGYSFQPSKSAQDTLTALTAKMGAQRELRRELKDSLKAVAYSVTTRKALAAALPEFEKYLPADVGAASRSLPVVANVVTSFVKAGWPKGKKPEQEAA